VPVLKIVWIHFMKKLHGMHTLQGACRVVNPGEINWVILKSQLNIKTLFRKRLMA
jgi:hypothetical protein